MTEVIDPNFLEQRKAALRRACEEWLLEIRSNTGRDELTPAERRKFNATRAELREIDAELSRISQINSAVSRLSARTGGGDTNPSSTPRKTMFNDQHLTYRRHDRRTSWVRDLVLLQTGMDDSGECRRRLSAHAREVAEAPEFMEYRDLSRTDGAGGYAVPPAWLMDQYIELARPGRAFANLCQRLPLPAGTDSINVPKVLTGTAVGIQIADNTAVTDVDLTDTFINAPVRTISGQQGVSIQLLDQSPIAFDDVVFRDLVAAHAGVTDVQVMAGTGTNGQVLGVDSTPGINTIAVSSVDVQGIYSAIANAVQSIHTTRFMPPEVIVMHPRRWGWLLSLLDGNQRPLFLPNAQGPFNAGGILTDVASQQVVGTVQGLPIVTDPNITTTAGLESPTGTEDVIYVLRASDLVLYESGIRARVLPETKAANLTVLLQIYSYLAFTAGRYPQSVVQITGLTPPAW
jgi:HK97 family phage major capsid protein